MKNLRSALLALGFSLVLMLGLATPSAAIADSPGPAGGNSVAADQWCQDWFDAFTYGVACHDFALDYRARALCANGATALGPWKRSGWSYAYCSTYGSFLQSFRVETRGRSPLASASASSTLVRTTTMTGATAAAIPCQSWWDVNTFGLACANNPAHNGYRAGAECVNDQTVYGPWRNNWAWSYAYCSSVGSSIRYNIRDFR
ncbi:hypothetical protein V1634_15925 [Plantactinospora veratri]|uniref:Uncharacterized protein n=1 Tax=Plantactinospora veratri TaxID=1436122 RepID=A0ABU7SEE1_9ACTN